MKKYINNYDYCENTWLAIETADEIIDLLNRGEYDDLYLAVSETIDRKLIYTCDLWEIMKTYQSPEEANLREAVDMFAEEVYSIIAVEEEDEEEDEEEEDEEDAD